MRGEGGAIVALGDDVGRAEAGFGSELAPLLQASRKEVYTWEEADEALQMSEVWR